MTKQQLRNIYKQKRLDVSSKEKLKLDDLMLLKLQTFNFEFIQSLLTFWPMANMAEPNTLLYSGYLRHVVQGLQIAYPVSDFTANIMLAKIINDNTVYNTNQYGITEPQEGKTLDPIDIDLIFVPLLAYDKNGYRVGFGKGFYDRFLNQCREDVVLMGFSYFEPVDLITDANEFDIPLNFCITPNKVHEF